MSLAKGLAHCECSTKGSEPVAHSPARPQAPAVQDCLVPPAKKQRERCTGVGDGRRGLGTPRAPGLGDHPSGERPAACLQIANERQGWKSSGTEPLGPDVTPVTGHAFPLTGPGQTTRHPDVYISCGSFSNPVHFAGAGQVQGPAWGTQRVRGRAGIGTLVCLTEHPVPLHQAALQQGAKAVKDPPGFCPQFQGES